MMEQLLPWSLYFLLMLVLSILLYLKPKGHKHRKNAPRLPPGPWRLPVIGSLHHLLSPLRHRALADLARRCNAPVMYLRLGEVPVVVVTSPDSAREIMKTHDAVFATRPLTRTIQATVTDGLGVVLAPSGAQWRQLRKICSLELLSARRVRSFRRVREEEVARLIGAVNAAPPGEKVNVSMLIAAYVTDSALRSIMGQRFRRREEFLEMLAEGVKIIAGFSLGDLFPSSKLACELGGTVRKAKAFRGRSSELVDYAIEQHRERRAAAADGVGVGDEDLMGILLRIQEEGGLEEPLSMGAVKAVILDLFAAGSESTTTTLQWAMSQLMRNPRVLQKLQSELRDTFQGKANVTEDDLIDLKYLKLVIKETLRLHPGTPLLIPRECQEPCKILGYDVPKGTMVLVNAWAIARDPKYWDDAEMFKPERFEDSSVDCKGTDFEFIPFGAGRRMCPGMAFAQANMELALAALLYHFDWQLPAGCTPDGLDMAEELGITLRRKRDLCLRPTVRVPPVAA